MDNFNIGDIIEYCGSTFKGESYREQKVIDVTYYDVCVTMFLDTNKMNSFKFNSQYHLDSVLIMVNSEYSNGVPTIWEDVV